MKGRRRSKKWDDAVPLYERDGMSLKEIAAKMGCDWELVRSALRIRGVTLRRRGRASGPMNKSFPIKSRSLAPGFIHRAIQEGRLVRPETCSECGRKPRKRKDGRANIDAHHDDYNKVYEVRWMCRKCRQVWHKGNKPVPSVAEAA